MTASTGAVADSGLCTLWNPSADRRLGLKRLTLARQSAAGNLIAIALRRASARGTPGATVTPTIVDNFDRALAPVSGALFDLALYSVLPTYEALHLDAAWANDAIGAEFSWYFDPVLWIPPGAGVGAAQITTLTVGPFFCTAEWLE